MKKDIGIKIISFLLSTIMVVLISLIVLFLVYVYNDQKKDLEDIQAVATSEIKGEITSIVIPKDKTQEEPIIVNMDPPVISNNNTVDNDSNRFYYNNLDKYSKQIYTSLNDQKEKLKTGNGIIDLPNDIVEVLNSGEEDTVKAILTIAMNAFEYDNPDIFYIDMSKMILFYEKDSLGNYKICIKNDNEYNNYLMDGINSKSEVDSYINEIEIEVQQIEREIEAQNLDTDYKKVLYIHDWIVNNSKYDETLSRVNRSNIYGILKEKEATCGGYAKTFKYLMDKLNINCIVVQGKATNSNQTEYHAWNYVEIDGNWYGVDCTWDDPVVTGSVAEGTQILSHDYFLKGQNVFNTSHEPFVTFYGTDVPINYPNLF